ncbi:hypothetical protein [Amnibacterium endophyticum]|uniref:Uncharacterized protein n=1 Tax=Amnibacterium endophyticum TaxID=2109337 RepID=A0ABW4LCB3_9MICO
MSTLRIWVMVATAAIVAVLAGGFFLGVQPQLAAAATADESAASAEAQAQTMQLKLLTLSKRAAKLESMQAEDAVLQKKVPSILKDNTFNRRINEVAALNGVTVASVQLGKAAAYTSPAGSAAPATQDAATPAASASPSAAPAAPVAATPTTAKTDPLITPANFAVVPASVTVTGTQDSVLRFSTAIQDDERVFLITNPTTSRNDDGTVTAVLSGAIYTLQR